MRPFQTLLRVVVLIVAAIEMVHSWIPQPSRTQRAHTTGNSHALFAAALFDVSIWKDDHWELDPAESTKQLPHAQETWNWCRHFVVKYGLCPWALQSTETKHAIHFYVLQDASVLEDAVELVALEFHQSQKNPQTTISFVILVSDNEKSNNSETRMSFDDFYNRYIDLEDGFFEHDNPILRDDVVLAPFHPDWMFAGEDPVLSFEKRSPYATISIVSLHAIEQAGPMVTEQIGRHNARILNSRSVEEWQSIYNSAIDSSRDGSSFD